jgi:hypothetical protein
MAFLRAWYHVARAEVLPRLRSRRFPLVAAAGLFLSHVVTAGDVELVVAGRFRGIENTAWIGSVAALTASTAVLFAGFFLTRGAVRRDRSRGAAPLVASSPIRSGTYLFGKWAGATAYLLALVGVMAAGAAGLFALRRTAGGGPLAFAVPFLLFPAPVAAAVASVAVAFDCLPGLNGSAGAAVYLVGAVVVVGLPATGSVPLDVTGLGAVRGSLQQAAAAEHPSVDPGAGFVFGYVRDVGALTSFPWGGVAVTTELVAERLGLVGAGAALVAGAALAFRRFDPAPGFLARLRGPLRAALPLPRFPGEADASSPRAGERASSPALASSDADAAPGSSTGPSLAPAQRALRPAWLFALELRIAVARRSWTWWIGAFGIAGAGAALPEAPGVLAAAWLWPLPAWAGLASRASSRRLRPLVGASLCARTQKVSAWAAGAVLPLALTAGPLLLAGRLGGLVGAAFVPALALAAGRFAESVPAFHGAYLGLWYLGPANRVAALDFSGAAAAPPATLAAFAGAAVLFLVAVVGAQRRPFG